MFNAIERARAEWQVASGKWQIPISHFPFSTPRSGYIVLLSVLVIGAIAIATASSLVLLGISAQQSGFAVVKAEQALENARTCVERAVRSLRLSSAYTGNQTFVLVEGTCSLRTIAGSGNANRIICAEGKSTRSTRRLEVELSQILPTTKVKSYKEVQTFTLCP